jgi:geranylgeranyl diphosphate synthase type II
MTPTHDLRAFLDERRTLVERALEGFVPPAETPPACLHEAMRYSVFSGGKRLRPILVLAVHEMLGGVGDSILAPAAATELVHTYSLIHDDLPAMDDDDLRRGKATCHRVFGEGLAVLAGDALLTLAFEIVAAEAGLSPEVRTAVALELARANGGAGMVGGQAADIASEGEAPSVETIDFIHLRKTALPIRAAVRIGALVAGARPRDLEDVSAYGRAVGLAFQISDDLLDLTGSEAEMGKAVGKDHTRGKLTYPAAVGVEAADERARELAGEAIGHLERFGKAAWPLKAIAHYVVERRS